MDGVDAMTDDDGSPTSAASKFVMQAHASVSNDEILVASRFPEMIGYDATCKTNDHGHKLAYVIGCNSEWKNINFLSTMLKNEKKRNFSFVFDVCLPFVYGQEVLEGCTLLLSDGDPHLIDVMETTVKTGCLPNAKRRRCYFHAGNKSYETDYGKFSTSDGGIGDIVRGSVKTIFFYTENTDEFQREWDTVTSWLTAVPENKHFTE